MPATAKIQTAKLPVRPASKPAKARSSIARRERNCSVARTLDIVSDAWAFLVIREAFFGTQTFEAFRSALGIPRATLTDRLRKLTQLAIFRQVANGSSRRKEYRLTKMGFDLYPSFIALMQFGDRWLAGGKPVPLTLIHINCGCAMSIRRARRSQHPAGLRWNPLSARASQFGVTSAANHRRQMELHGRPRSLFRQSALRQDPDRA